MAFNVGGVDAATEPVPVVLIAEFTGIVVSAVCEVAACASIWSINTPNPV